MAVSFHGVRARLRLTPQRAGPVLGRLQLSSQSQLPLDRLADRQQRRPRRRAGVIVEEPGLDVLEALERAHEAVILAILRHACAIGLG
jgi:hypothetical protein